MLQGTTESRLAHSLLMSLTTSNEPLAVMFYDTYRTFFSPGKVKAVESIEVQGNPMIVKVDRQKAIEYLKMTYEFFTKEELEVVIQDVVKDTQDVSQ